MPIPRRIIQTHRDATMEPYLRQSWIDHHPDYEYRFFDDADCRALIADRMPELLGTYDVLPLAVQKADLFRYIALHEMGGLYADVDTVCLAPLHSYVDLASEHLHVCPEMQPSRWPGGAEDYALHFCNPRQFLQWTLCSPPGHPLLADVIERIARLVAQYAPSELVLASENMRTTLQLTGPHLFSNMIEVYLHKEGAAARLTLLPHLAWGAYPWEQCHPMFGPAIKVCHLFHGTWLGKPEQLRMPAPLRLKQRY